MPVARWSFLSIVFGTTLLAVGPATRADEFEAIRDKIRQALVRQNIPSIAVAVARDGQILWEEGFGWADRERRRPATEHTMYSLASISKPITATGLMVLKEQGKVDLDKPANDYLGAGQLRACLGDVNQATVRRVANHTAGLAMHYQFFYRDEAARPPTRDESIRRYGLLITEPGERYQYANLGYGVLDEIIAHVSGQSYADFMREKVFVPLGLTHMSVDIGPGLEEYVAIRYGGDGLPLAHYDFDHPGASAVYSSAHELVRFGMFHLKAHLPDQAPILTDATIDEMHAVTASTGERDGSGYGVGWGTSKMRGQTVISHSGGMPGVSTLLSLVPEQRLAIVVLVNSRANLVGSLTEQILKQVVPEEKQSEQATTAPGAPQVGGGAARADEAQDASPAATLEGLWEGKLATYEGDVPVKLWVLESGEMHL
ncbi:MAG: beta-lactamase family protein, partial [Planctomycetaceae bacterium]|nr:beta-lactamase family protein [Planctomycetaceae bacterium]